MKKLFLMILAASAIISTGKAQVAGLDFRDQLLFGVKIGANVSNVYSSQGEAFNTTAKLGLAAGVFISIPIGTYLGIQPELLLSQKGFKATGMILGSAYDFTRTTTYIDVPLLFALKPSEFLTILAGPQFSYLTKQKDVFTNSTTSIAQEQEFENASVRTNTFCLTGGIDINLSMLVLSARAGWDVQNNNSDGSTTTPRYKNAWYQATLGIRF